MIVDATYTKILKPDPRAYEQVLAELALDRADCVFVDDQKKISKGRRQSTCRMCTST